MRRIFFTIILLLSAIILKAQNDLALAMQYYNSAEYDKAASIFEDIYKRTNSKYYFNYYIKSLVNSNNTAKAKKTVKREIKRHPKDKTYLVDLGYLQKITGEEESAKKTFTQVIKTLPRNTAQINAIARSFINYKLYNWAELTYLRGKEITGYGFYPELANLYTLQRNTDKMIDVLLNWLAEKPTSKDYVQKLFSSYLRNDVNDEFYSKLENKLLERSKTSRSKVYTEILWWLYNQHGDFDKALKYAKILDKKYNEYGVRPYQTGLLAYKSKQYDLARQALNYVAQQPNSPYSYEAQRLLLQVMRIEIMQNDSVSQEKLLELEKMYKEFLPNAIYDKNMYELYCQLADLQAFYLNNPQQAMATLNSIPYRHGINPKLEGPILIEKAKILLLQNKPWDAILLYSQVYDKNKNNEVGDSAKYLLANLYYYLGEFKWAKAHYDALKRSTSKLIANDAFAKSVLLEKFLEDSIEIGSLKILAKAEKYAFINKTDSALILLDSLEKSTTYMADHILFTQYSIYAGKGNEPKALDALNTLIKKYPNSLLADRALFFAAKIYEQAGEPGKAAEYYKKILFEHKGSIFTEEARDNYRRLEKKLKNRQPQ